MRVCSNYVFLAELAEFEPKRVTHLSEQIEAAIKIIANDRSENKS